ncbi:MAG: hypothetical protein M3348_00050 [Acidobacteriota bacterium]|nr:hypothetical protein [Acidobacteriota bacterium]
MRLKAAQRDALPDSAFAIPEKRAYPIHDHNHAVAALSEVAQHGTPSEKARVRAAVRKRYPGIGRPEPDGDEGAQATAASDNDGDEYPKKRRRGGPPVMRNFADPSERGM